MSLRYLLTCTLTLLLASALAGCTRNLPREPDALARLTLSDDPREATGAMAALRQHGPAGLVSLLAFADTLKPSPRLDAAIDAVAAQKDARASRLYWYDDFDKARVAALLSGRPILSLRLLGRLDQDLSCANSRFFRSVLYPNAEISKLLREHFVLHWQSVRPVPTLTVDFGDGRTLVTTITGNSIHYILTPDGQPVDALPGLYGPAAFLSGLEVAERIARECASLPPDTRNDRLAVHHAERLAVLEQQLRADLDTVAPGQDQELPRPVALGGDGNSEFRDDIVFKTGSFVTYPEGSKDNAELSMARQLVPDVEPLELMLPTETWSALARLHETDADLDAGSRRLIESKARAARQGTLEPLFENLRRSVAEDTIRSEHLHHAALHAWFAAGSVPQDVEQLNLRVYRELFLSPASDAWMGMVPPDIYRALDGNGLGL